MIKEVHVELFRFDSKVDYLPYYKKYTLEYKDKDTILSLLNKINSIEKFAYEPSVDFNLKINNLYLNSNEFIANIVDKTSNEFIIEPISKFRAINDLIIDKKDFLQKIAAFESYLTSMDMDKYAKNYELDYYASNTYNIKRDYIGDHSLLIASDIIEQNPELTDEILEMISKKDDGIWYHTSLENRVFNYDVTKEHKIKALFAKLKKVQFSGIDNSSVDSIDNVDISQYFEGFNVASYDGLDKSSCASVIKDSKANYIDISLKSEDLAPHSTLVSDDFSLKIAGEILLQAKDNNADFIVVRGKKDILLFDGEQRKIEKTTGREINLPVVSQEQFKRLLEGDKDTAAMGLDSHKVKVSFL
ncbi:MAG: 2Fe-2S iron-sulfur cluster-binding protein [Sulfurimonas sp.]|uniref:2Fe-2S iron-sulfur cluster-binding protein n=1 Tax=Sulfurimonas sp. TaxID=2022749 RepID=UPI00260D31F3|nr:2Fe-2S iron-sulfur cluster-binding protein [Sulfurimonas sp.]MCW8895083.1 2Fe-2S iron-sulfur cluster-binding protein [Sulfurimonas sp.]MCW8954346.1 2Fe-2S iron-sulfur cluster-binding protein [Sulfurimonas sp.]MCW9066963.1 2Fe-2S iron-sulfur cluster-binding protein [Sulfurimonas sp.]